MKLLLHICCGPDLTYAYEYFSKNYDVTGYFYNLNIDTADEYERRFEAADKVGRHYGFDVIKGHYEPEVFLNAVKGMEELPEKSRRCLKCHRVNLKATAMKAKSLNIDNFSTTLTISPHKPAEKINAIGRDISEMPGINFLEAILRKDNGFKKSVDISKELGLYRQNYCGCKFSRR
ncbi:MAG: epoxyqueuosine reductase QueH [candidate division WOR-3 bacterium]|nr:epoxyqueuosine reductase QueH [candidate division WOR-3 bacterium]